MVGIKRFLLLLLACSLFVIFGLPAPDSSRLAAPNQSGNLGPEPQTSLAHGYGTVQQAGGEGVLPGSGQPDKPLLQESSTDWGEYAAEFGNQSDGRLNVLFMGIDARGKEPSRSDSMILLSINPEDNTAVVMSIMRDTYVTISAPKPVRNRINTAYAIGGPALAAKTVSSFLQVPVKYYMVMDFQGFEKAIDAIGGVELDVEKRMDYKDDGVYDIHLQAGRQILNGRQALGYARFRHDIKGDYARVERQRKLLGAVKDKIQGIQAVYYLPKIIEAVRPYVETNLDFPALAGLAYLGSRLQEIRAYTVPAAASHHVQSVNGMAVLIPDIDKTRREVRAYLR